MGHVWKKDDMRASKWELSVTTCRSQMQEFVSLPNHPPSRIVTYTYTNIYVMNSWVTFGYQNQAEVFWKKPLVARLQLQGGVIALELGSLGGSDLGVGGNKWKIGRKTAIFFWARKTAMCRGSKTAMTFPYNRGWENQPNFVGVYIPIFKDGNHLPKDG